MKLPDAVNEFHFSGLSVIAVILALEVYNLDGVGCIITDLPVLGCVPKIFKYEVHVIPPIL